jgi:hypothetical protein
MPSQITNISGSWVVSSGNAPGGASTSVQFNDGGAWGGDPGLTYDKNTDVLTAGTVRATQLTGSLTKLSDGTSYLVAGTGITLTTGSSGAVTVAASVASSPITASYIDTVQSMNAGWGDLATVGPSVTVTTNTSVACFINAQVYPSTNAGNAFIGVAVSGATVVTASDDNSVWATTPIAGNTQVLSTGIVFTGLTSGSNTFTMKYRTSGDAVENFYRRRIAVLRLD